MQINISFLFVCYVIQCNNDVPVFLSHDFLHLNDKINWIPNTKKKSSCLRPIFFLQLACIDHDIDFKKDNSSMFISVKHFLNTFVMTNFVDYLNLYVDGCLEYVHQSSEQPEWLPKRCGTILSSLSCYWWHTCNI